MTKEVLNHLCEAYLFGALYQTDFISLLRVKKSKQQEFKDKMWNRCEEWEKEQQRLKAENPIGSYNDYERGGEAMADYLLTIK